MSSRCLASLLLLVMASGCHREERDYRNSMMASADRSAAYKGNAWHIAQGQRLFGWMNCSGCHSRGGGGMGPALRDAKWRYGSSMQDIVNTILDGRPNGMPSFRDRITDDQAWQLAAYVTSMSARVRQDALAGRAEEPASVEPPTLDERKAPRAVTPEQDNAQTKRSTR